MTAHVDTASGILLARNALPAEILGVTGAAKVAFGETAQTLRVWQRATPEIVANLKNKYGNDLATEFQVDPQLLGGMRIRVGSDVWDGSVRNRLQRLQHEL